MRSRLRTLSVTALGAYDGGLRRAVLALKSGRRDVARGFAERLCDLVESGELLVPIPTTAARRRERGFDGCELIARIVCEHRDGRILAELAQTRGDRQRGRNREQRLAACGRFGWRGEALQGARVVLLDDVVTTGATLEDCASAIRSAGGVVTQALAVAITL